MTKLKTLKDLKEDIIKILREVKCPNPKATAEFIAEKGKAEAVKWAKHYKNERGKDIEKKYKDRAFGAMRAIMQMHNLTREDLKDE